MKPEDVHLRDVLFEFHQVGGTVRVIAIDPISGVEATMVGSPKYGQEALKRIAIRKLRYVIAKRSSTN